MFIQKVITRYTDGTRTYKGVITSRLCDANCNEGNIQAGDSTGSFDLQSYCCKTDYCNAAIRSGSAGLFIVALIAIIVMFVCVN